MQFIKNQDGSLGTSFWYSGGILSTHDLTIAEALATYNVRNNATNDGIEIHGNSGWVAANPNTIITLNNGGAAVETSFIDWYIQSQFSFYL